MANLVSDETMKKLVAAGWDGPRPDAQELADQLPVSLTLGRLYVEYAHNPSEPMSWFAGYNNSDPATAGDTMAEALAALWLTLSRDNTEPTKPRSADGALSNDLLGGADNE